MSEDILQFDTQRYADQMSLEDKNYVDWHSKNTIAFGSLIDDGWDWGRDDWTCYSVKPEYLEVIRDRINEKIEDEYFFREIGVLPVGKFKKILKRTINEAMAKQGPIYNEIAEGLELTMVRSDKFKERTIHSDYPQAQLSPSSKDYASNADEKANERTLKGGPVSAILMYSDGFNEPDAEVVKAVSKCFSNLLSFNL